MLLVRNCLNRILYRETARAPPLCTESAGLGATARGLYGYGMGATGRG